MVQGNGVRVGGKGNAYDQASLADAGGRAVVACEGISYGVGNQVSYRRSHGSDLSGGRVVRNTFSIMELGRHDVAFQSEKNANTDVCIFFFPTSGSLRLTLVPPPLSP